MVYWREIPSFDLSINLPTHNGILQVKLKDSHQESKFTYSVDGSEIPNNHLLGGGFKYFLCSPRTLGKWSNLTHIFSDGVASTTN